jgi:hypothetical protein
VWRRARVERAVNFYRIEVRGVEGQAVGRFHPLLDRTQLSQPAGDVCRKGHNSWVALRYGACGGTMSELTFDIFAGASDEHAIWRESVDGLPIARERLQQIAADDPGQYFIMCCASHTIMGRIETFAIPARSNAHNLAKHTAKAWVRTQA